MLLPGAAAPVRGGNDERWDLPTQYIPWTKAVSDAYRDGRLPLRFAANGCGNPLWANPQAQVLTPTTWITWPLPVPWALAVAAALRLWLAAAGTYLWLRRRRASEPAAAAGGLAYGFSLAFTTWLHYPLTYPQALVPWILLALERLAGGERAGLAAATVALAALLLGGYPEGELLAAASGACLFAALLLRRRDRARRLGRFALAAGTALGLTAVVWLPQLQAILGSERSARVARAGSPPAPPLTWNLLRPPPDLDLLRYWVVPEARGNPRDGDKFGPYSFAGRTSGYAGILVLAFALAAFAWRRAPWAVWLARIALVLLVLYILAFPPLRWLTDAVPGVRFVMHRVTTGRLQVLAVFLTAALAAFQLDRLRTGKGRAAAIAACTIVLLAIAVVLAQRLGNPNPDPDPAHAPLTAWSAVRFVLPALLLAATLVLLALPPSPRRAEVLTALFLAGTALELLRIGARFNPGTRRADYFPATPVVRELRAAAAGGRFAANTGALSGMAYMYGLEDVGMQDPMTPARYLDALAAGTDYDAPAHPLGNVGRIGAPMLDFLNARARLDGEAVRHTAAPDGILPERLIGCADDAELLRRLGAEPDLVHTALIVGREETFSGRAAIVSLERPRPELLRARVRSDAARVLVLPESDDGGWSADVEGQPVPTLSVNGAFLGIRIPAGDTRIVCRYLPPGFRRGALISAVTLAAAAAAAAVLARRRA